MTGLKSLSASFLLATLVVVALISPGVADPKPILIPPPAIPLPMMVFGPALMGAIPAFAIGKILGLALKRKRTKKYSYYHGRRRRRHVIEPELDGFLRIARTKNSERTDQPRIALF